MLLCMEVSRLFPFACCLDGEIKHSLLLWEGAGDGLSRSLLFR